METAVSEALDGLKVADFTWVLAGPLITHYLSAHGATVVKIESKARPDALRTSGPFKDNIPGVDRSGYFAFANANKYSISINMSIKAGVQVAKKLISWADVVAENFTPGTMEKWGLGYEEIKKIKPDIIFLRTSNQGQTGPQSKRPGFGQQLVGLSGFSFYTGWPDRDPIGFGMAYTDIITPRFATAALIAALDYRRRTKKGMLLDISQTEASIHFLASIVLDYTVNKRIGNRSGNRCPYAAPHGAYPCKGKDKWCAIAVFTDDEWGRFGDVVGKPWTKEVSFATLLGRKANEDELDKLVAEWTSNLSDEEVVKLLQGAGIAAGNVKNVGDVLNDHQLKQRNTFWELEHNVLGPFLHLGSPFILSRAPARPKMAAPCLGENTEYICTKILGMSDEEFVDLVIAGTFD